MCIRDRSYPDLSCSRDFSKTHRRTQRHHSWIAITCAEVGKLLRSQLNSQILRYLHFSHPFTSIFDSPFEIKFPLPLYYSRAVSLCCRATSFLVERPSLTGTALPFLSLPDPSHEYFIVVLLSSGRPRRAHPEHSKICLLYTSPSPRD